MLLCQVRTKREIIGLGVCEIDGWVHKGRPVAYDVQTPDGGCLDNQDLTPMQRLMVRANVVDAAIKEMN